MTLGYNCRVHLTILKRFRKWLAWLALSGVAFSALLPLVATAQPASSLTSIVICTQSGFQTIALDASGKLVPGKEHPGKPHCPLCIAPLDNALLPSPVLLPVPATLVALEVLAPLAIAPRRRLASLQPPSRAPPLNPLA